MLNILVAFKHPPDSALLQSLQPHRVAVLPPDQPLGKGIARENFDVVLLQGGLKRLRAMKAADARAEVILFSDGSFDVVEAAREGAHACFAWPHIDDELLRHLAQIQELIELRQETARLEQALSSKYVYHGVVGKNPAMLDIFDFIRRVAPYYRTLTITGETGTGKEGIAKAIHQESPVRNQPFVALNCGGVVAELIESELFGHVKGSFTGAVSDKTGLFEAAGAGTLFLDEIATLPLSQQPHLLRVLENGEFRPVGGNRTLKARCRIVAATNVDLAEEVKAGRFRDDLYYRLSPLTLRLPPLRERKGDILLLMRHFLELAAQRTGKDLKGFSRCAQKALLAHAWPGNVRELENVIQRAAMLTEASYIQCEDLPGELGGGENSTQTLTLDEAIRQHIQSVLTLSHGNRTHAAKRLGISRHALLRKLEKHGIS